VNDLIVATKLSKSFPTPDGKDKFNVLEDVDLTVASGEVVALLGRSGSGKSTLLRIMAGLIPASGGTVTSDGKPVNGPNPDVAMVFQSFALLPWLTVSENVELGLETLGLKRAERSKRALGAINLVGLDGFEGAYPKELSGGMKQRVGFARALVVEPQVLFMDEPFSALDVLTAENLRGEIDDLWNAGTFPAKSILIVTHNIEEAVFLADRVIVLGANPGRVRGIVVIDLPRPHNRSGDRYKALVEHLYAIMTNPAMKVGTASGGVPGRNGAPYSHPLPHVRAGTISGLLEFILEKCGDGGLEAARIAESLALPVDDFFSILDAAVLLGFATVHAGVVALTPEGRAFADAAIGPSKGIFREQVRKHAPIVAAMTATLTEKEDHSMRSEFFLDVLEEYYPEAEAKLQLATAIEWGRYAELFEFDAVRERLLLPERGAAPA